MNQNIMNSLLLIWIVGLFFCNSSKKNLFSQNNFQIVGTWSQVKTVLGNENSHMATPNLWNFKENNCKMIKDNAEYGYKVSNNQFEFYPLKGHTYAEWQEVLMFGRFNIDITDSTMVLTRKDTLQLFFERYPNK